jgi:hypothetical protein
MTKRWLHVLLVVGLARGDVPRGRCAFRSVLPMLDEPRVCLHDTVVSRIAVGRSVATAAELCFAAQWALLLRAAGSRAHAAVATVVASLLLPLAVAAEAFSWVAVLTRNNLLHAIENALWTLGGALALCAVLVLREVADKRGRRALRAVAVGSVSYLGFMVVVDVPMYLARWHASAAAGVPALSIAEGWTEIGARCQVVRDVSAWSADPPRRAASAPLRLDRKAALKLGDCRQLETLVQLLSRRQLRDFRGPQPRDGVELTNIEPTHAAHDVGTEQTVVLLAMPPVAELDDVRHVQSELFAELALDSVHGLLVRQDPPARQSPFRPLATAA